MGGDQVGSIYYDARIETAGIKQDAAKVEQTVENTGGKVERTGRRSFKAFQVAAVAAFAAVSAAVATNIDKAVKRVDTLNNSNRTFKNMGFTAKEVSDAMKTLEGSIRGLPTSLDDAIRNVQLLAASTNDVGKSQEIFAALNNGILGFGGSAADVSNAVRQLSQDLAGGTIQAETWNSMLDSGLGPTLAAIARQMGMTTKELKTGLSEGKVSVETFTDSLIKMNKKGGGGMASLEKIAKDSTSGIATGWQNAQTAVVRGIAKIIEAVGSKRISSAISDIGSAFEKVLTVVAELVPAMVKLAPSVITVGAAIMGYRAAVFAANAVTTIHSALIFAMGTRYMVLNGTIVAVRGAVTGATVAQVAWNRVMSLNPIGLVVGAAIALAGAVVSLTGKENQSTSATERLKAAHDRLKVSTDALKQSSDALKGALLDHEGAALRVEQAQKNYNDTVAMYGPKSLQARQAAHDLKRAENDLKTANDNVKTATEEKGKAEKKVADQKKAVQEAESIKRAAFNKTADTIDFQTKLLGGLSTKLGALDGKTFGYTLQMRTQDIKVAADGVSSPAAKNAAKKRLGYSAGGYTGRGGKEDVAGIVHRGEYVIPKEHVNQNTGLPLLSGFLDAFGSNVMSPTIGQAEGSQNGSGGQIENNIGTINVASDVDADRLIRRLTGDQEAISNNLTPLQRYGATA